VGDKRFEWLIEATVDLIGRGYDVHTILVGDGEEREMLEQRVARRDLGERFRFAGFRDDVAELMGAADIVALPSRLEGMPNVVLEALGLGIAVVATNAGGLGELIKPEKDALISDLNDYGEFLANLERAILDPDLRNRLGQAGLDVVRRNHGWERMVDDMESIIDRVACG
jgi:glycosyltransferase involved in cell wall biosynthesis